MPSLSLANLLHPLWLRLTHYEKQDKSNNAACNSAGKRTTFRQETWHGGCCWGESNQRWGIIPGPTYWMSLSHTHHHLSPGCPIVRPKRARTEERKEDSRNINKRFEAVKRRKLSRSSHWAASRGGQIKHVNTLAGWDWSLKGNWVLQYHHMRTYHTELNSIDLASLLLTDQNLSQNASDCDPTQRERKQRRQEMIMRGSRKGLHEASAPEIHLWIPCQPYTWPQWLSAWKYMCVCELTYGLNHCHPAHPLCSCRMGTFV